jgi:hypothetical protein
METLGHGSQRPTEPVTLDKSHTIPWGPQPGTYQDAQDAEAREMEMLFPPPHLPSDSSLSSVWVSDNPGLLFRE